MGNRKCNAAFKRSILLQCYDAMEAEGFTRFDRLGVDWPLDSNFHCWIGLNAALYPDRVELVPNVGLHVTSIEQLFCTLDEGEYSTKYNRGIATYAINLGSIDEIADERAFTFGPEQSEFFVQSECARLAKIYATFGLDYVKSIASYEALEPLLKEQVETLGGNPERFASCLYFMGREGEAKDFLINFPEKYKKFIQGFSLPFLVSTPCDLRPDFPPAVGRIHRLISGLTQPWFPVSISMQIPEALDCPGMSGVCVGCSLPSMR